MTAKPAPAFKRRSPEARTQQILAAATKLSRKVGYRNITRDAVAVEAGAAQGLVNRYFGNIDGLRDAVIRDAVERGDTKLVAQGLAARNRHALKAPAELREAAAASLAG